MLIQQVESRRLLSRSYTQNLFRAGLVVLILMGLGLPGRAQDSNSAIQLTITDALLSAHCVPAAAQNNTLPFQSDAISRTLTIQGVNFLNGATPLVTLGSVGLPLSSSTAPTATAITVNFDCSQFSTGTYRLHVSTGTGTPYNGDFFFSFSTQGPAGSNGAKGDRGDAGPQGADGLHGNDGTNGKDGALGLNGTNGKDGAPGQNGTNGKDGAPGQNGSNGKDGAPGLNGKGHHVVVTKLLPGSICPTGGNQQDFYTIAPDGTMTLVDTEYLCHGSNGAQGPQGNQGANGRDGAPGLNGFNGGQGPQGPQGQQGPPGVAKGWHKKFDSSAITSTSTIVLSQVVTGTPAYLIDAKINSPFANNAKSVACTLTAVDNGVTTIIDSSDALLIGNTQTTAKGGISLAGVYNASSSSASVTFNVSCATGGDTRTLTNGRMNIVGANSVAQ